MSNHKVLEARVEAAWNKGAKEFYGADAGAREAIKEMIAILAEQQTRSTS